MNVILRDSKNYPFVEQLVNAFYTDEINDILHSDNVQYDKKIFLMYIVLYFIIALHDDMDADMIKKCLSDIIRTPSIRLQLVTTFQTLENCIIDTKQKLLER